MPEVLQGVFGVIQGVCQRVSCCRQDQSFFCSVRIYSCIRSSREQSTPIQSAHNCQINFYNPFNFDPGVSDGNEEVDQLPILLVHA